ncbi:MAG: flagellar export protein FliJ [Planctomycetaceae bacterium]|nr:flagellar export protein FliJ [Planctomycetaceae bacterium]
MAKAFQFRLEQLLGIRRQKEELAQRELAAAQAAVAARNKSILFLMDQEERGKNELRAMQDTCLDVGRLKLADEYLSSLGRLLRREQETLHDLVRVEIERRHQVVEARKGVKVLERFRETKLRRHRQEAGLEERKFLDEIGQNLAKGA